MKDKMKKTLALAAAFLGLHAFAATPIVVWDGANGDFAEAKRTKGDFSLALEQDKHTVATDGSSITIGNTATKGVLVNWSNSNNAFSGYITVIVKYSGYDPAATTSDGILASLWANASSYDIVGPATTAATGIIKNIWDSAIYTGTDVTVNNKTPQASGYFAVTYSGQSGSTKGSVTYVSNASGGYEQACSGLNKLYTTTTDFRGFSIGGPRSANLAAQKGLVIEKVAIFNSVLSSSDIAAYKFPSQVTTAYKNWGYANAVYTWGAKTSNFHDSTAKYKRFDISTGADMTGTTDGTDFFFGSNTPYKTIPGAIGGATRTFWAAAFCHTSNSGALGYRVPGAVLRFADSALSGNIGGTFAPFTIGGLIVESSAGDSYAAQETSSAARDTILGDPSGVYKTFFKLDSSFKIYRTGKLWLAGAIDLEIASGKTLDLNNSSTTDTQYPKLFASSTQSMGASTVGGELVMRGAGSIVAKGFTAEGSTLDFSNLATDRATPFLNCPLVINDATVIKLPANLPAGQAFKLATTISGVTGGQAAIRTIYLGNTPAQKVVTFDTTAGTITYSDGLDYRATVNNATVQWSTGSGLTTSQTWINDKTSAATITAPMNSTITFDTGITAGRFTIEGAGATTLAKGDGQAVVIDNYDFSAATGTTTVNFGTGSAAIEVGADTVLTQVGSGVLTIGANKKATVPGVWNNVSLNGGTVKYVGGGYATIPWLEDTAAINGTVEFAGTLSTGNGLSFGNANKTINLVDGCNVTIGGRLAIGNEDNTTQHVLQSGGTVHLNGTGDASGGSGNANTPLLISHWKGSNRSYKITGGELYAENGVIRLGWDGGATLQVGGGTGSAVLTAKGIRGGTDRIGKGTLTLDIRTNGTLKLGENGVSIQDGNNADMKLAGGTIVSYAYATVATSKAITLSAASTLAAESGKTLTVSSAVSGGASLTIGSNVNNGTVTLSGANALTGNITVEGGTLRIAANTGTLGTITVKSGATVELGDGVTATSIVGPGIVKKVGSGTTTIAAGVVNKTTKPASIEVTEGRLEFASGYFFGSQGENVALPLVISGGTLDLNDAATFTTANASGWLTQKSITLGGTAATKIEGGNVTFFNNAITDAIIYRGNDGVNAPAEFAANWHSSYSPNPYSRNILVEEGAGNVYDLLISGTFGLEGGQFNGTTVVKTGDGTAKFTGTYNFPYLTISAGTWIAASEKAIGTATTVNGGTLELAAGTQSGNITLNAGGTLNVTGDATSRDLVITSGSFSKADGATILLNGAALSDFVLDGNRLKNTAACDVYYKSGDLGVTSGANALVVTLDGTTVTDLRANDTVVIDLAKTEATSAGLASPFANAIVLPSCFTLNASGASPTCKISGTGTLDLTALSTYPTDTVKPTFENWTGVVVFPSAGELANLEKSINAWGNADSTVRLNNVGTTGSKGSGVGTYFSGGDKTITPKLEIVGNVYINNGSNQTKDYITSLTGNGLFTVDFNRTYGVEFTTLDRFTGTLAAACSGDTLTIKTVVLDAMPADGAVIVKLGTMSGAVDYANLVLKVGETVVTSAYAYSKTAQGIVATAQYTAPFTATLSASETDLSALEWRDSWGRVVPSATALAGAVVINAPDAAASDYTVRLDSAATFGSSITLGSYVKFDLNGYDLSNATLLGPGSVVVPAASTLGLAALLPSTMTISGAGVVARSAASVEDPTWNWASDWTGTYKLTLTASVPMPHCAASPDNTGWDITKMYNGTSSAFELNGTITGGYFANGGWSVGALVMNGSMTITDGFTKNGQVHNIYSFTGLSGAGTVAASVKNPFPVLWFKDTASFTGTISTTSNNSYGYRFVLGNGDLGTVGDDYPTKASITILGDTDFSFTASADNGFVVREGAAFNLMNKTLSKLPVSGDGIVSNGTVRTSGEITLGATLQNMTLVSLGGQIDLSDATIGNDVTLKADMASSVANTKPFVLPNGTSYNIVTLDGDEDFHRYDRTDGYIRLVDLGYKLTWLPIGDSITEGQENLATGGSYRYRIWEQFKRANGESGIQTVGFRSEHRGAKDDGSCPDCKWHGAVYGGLISPRNNNSTGIYAGLMENVETELATVGYPDIISVMLGINDLSFLPNGNAENIQLVFETWVELINSLAKARPNSKIIASTLLPVRPENVSYGRFGPFNNLIRAAAQAGEAPFDNPNVIFCDTCKVGFENAYNGAMFADGVHPNVAGSKLVARAFIQDGFSKAFKAIAAEQAKVVEVHNGTAGKIAVRFSKSLTNETVAANTTLTLNGTNLWDEAVLNVTSSTASYASDDHRVVLFDVPNVFSNGTYTASVTVNGKTYAVDDTVEYNIVGTGAAENVKPAYTEDFVPYQTITIENGETWATDAGFTVGSHTVVTNAAGAAHRFVNKVGYYMELKRPGEPATFVWVSMDAAAFGNETVKMGLPNTTAGSIKAIANGVTVFSNRGCVSRDVTGEGADSQAVIEFTPYAYGNAAQDGYPAGATPGNTFDWNDTLGTSGAFGCMQIARVTGSAGTRLEMAAEPLMAYNGFNSTDPSDVGIGVIAVHRNVNGTMGTTHPSCYDWTHITSQTRMEKFALGAYEVKKIEVWVMPFKSFTTAMATNKDFSKLEWEPQRPDVFSADSTLVITNTATATLTIDEAVAVAEMAFVNGSGNRMTLADATNLTASAYDFIEAAGKVAFDCTGFAPGAILSGTIVGFENVDTEHSVVPEGTHLYADATGVRLVSDVYRAFAANKAVLTYDGAGTFHSAYYNLFDIESGADTGTRYNGNDSSVTVIPGQSGVIDKSWKIFSSDATNGKYVAPGYVLRLAPGVGTPSAIDADFNPVTLGGMIVEAGATGFSLASNKGTSGYARNTELGDNRTAGGTDTWFVFEESFAFSRYGYDNSKLTLLGAVNFDIAAGKTVTLNKTVANSLPNLDTATHAQLKMHGEGTLAVGTLVATGEVTLDYTDIPLSRASAYIDGTLQIDDNTVIKLPADLVAGQAFPMATTLVGANSGKRTICLGDMASAKEVTFDAANGTILWNEVSPHVAKIGDTNYETLSNALEAVTSGQTITLLAHCNEPLATGKSFTFDLNGKLYGGAVTIADDAVVTIANTSDTPSAYNGYPVAKGETYTAVTGGRVGIALGTEQTYALTDELMAKVQFSGSGKVTYASATMPTLPAGIWADGWFGTFVYSGYNGNKTDWDPCSFYNGTLSKFEFAGTISADDSNKSYLRTTEFSLGELILTGSVAFNDGYTAIGDVVNNYRFTKLSGNGTLTISTTTTSSPGLKFGDVADFTGTINVQSGNASGYRVILGDGELLAVGDNPAKAAIHLTGIAELDTNVTLTAKNGVRVADDAVLRITDEGAAPKSCSALTFASGAEISLATRLSRLNAANGITVASGVTVPVSVVDATGLAAGDELVTWTSAPTGDFSLKVSAGIEPGAKGFTVAKDTTALKVAVEDTKTYYSAGDPTEASEDRPKVSFDDQWLEAAGVKTPETTTPEAVQHNLDKPNANGVKPSDAYLMGYEANKAAEAAIVIQPVQTANPNKVRLAVAGVPPEAARRNNAVVTYTVRTSTSRDMSEADETEIGKSTTVDMDLPTSGVRYYRIEANIDVSATQPSYAITVPSANIVASGAPLLTVPGEQYAASLGTKTLSAPASSLAVQLAGAGVYEGQEYHLEVTEPGNDSSATHYAVTAKVMSDKSVTFAFGKTAPANTTCKLTLLSASGAPNGNVKVVTDGFTGVTYPDVMVTARLADLPVKDGFGGSAGYNHYRIPSLATDGAGEVIACYDVRHFGGTASSDLGVSGGSGIDIGESYSSDFGLSFNDPILGIDVDNYYRPDGTTTGYSRHKDIGDVSMVWDPLRNQYWLIGITGKGLSGGTTNMADVVVYTRGKGEDAKWTPWANPTRTAAGITEPLDYRSIQQEVAAALGSSVCGATCGKGFLQGPGHGMVTKLTTTKGSVTIPAGTVVFPMQYFFDSASFNTARASVIYMKPGDATWTTMTGLTANDGSQENCVMELDDGTWYMMCKQQGAGKYKAWRTTDFQTWTDVNDGLSGVNNVQGSCLKIGADANGVGQYVFCHANDTSATPTRTKLTLFFGTDTTRNSDAKGISWDRDHGVMIDAGPNGMTYNSMAMLDANTLGILYECGGHIQFVRVDVSDKVTPTTSK